MAQISADRSSVLDERRWRSLVDRGIQQARRQERSLLVSLVVAVPACDPLAFFEGGDGGERVFWARPGDDQILVGVGAAWTLRLTGRDRFAEAALAWRGRRDGALLERDTEALGTGPVLLGGFSFDPLRPATDLWRDFPDGLLILPRYLLTESDQATWLTVNAFLTPESDGEAETAAFERVGEWLREGGDGKSRPESDRGDLLSAPEPWPHPQPLSIGKGEGSRTGAERGISPSPSPMERGRGDEAAARAKAPDPAKTPRSIADWQDTVRALVEQIRGGAAEKVVLAQARVVHGDARFDPTAMLRLLGSDYPSCYRFAVDLGGSCFIGASPEQLVRQRGTTVSTMCLAGSTARGATAEEDDALAAALLASPKNRAEHAIVVRGIGDRLRGLGIDLAPAGVPTLLKVRNIQHLFTPIAGHARAGQTILDLLGCLHPTPSVGGSPQSAALRLIREHEGFDRGWYAGPVGWLDDRGQGEFTVAIRSALLHGADATIFAGCGIVAGSEPAQEAEEARLKLQPILSALIRSM